MFINVYVWCKLNIHFDTAWQLKEVKLNSISHMPKSHASQATRSEIVRETERKRERETNTERECFCLELGLVANLWLAFGY